MSRPEKTWKLEELARAAGVSARTVRYYVQRGLLPAPAFHGRDTAYTTDHLTRLHAIKRLQDRFLPLDAIEVELAQRTTEQLQRLADGKEAAPPPRPPTHHVPRVRWPEPEPPPPPFVYPAAGERVIRFELAPGLELMISERADAATKALAEELRLRCHAHRPKGGSK